MFGIVFHLFVVILNLFVNILNLCVLILCLFVVMSCLFCDCFTCLWGHFVSLCGLSQAVLHHYVDILHLSFHCFAPFCVHLLDIPRGNVTSHFKQEARAHGLLPGRSISNIPRRSYAAREIQQDFPQRGINLWDCRAGPMCKVAVR